MREYRLYCLDGGGRITKAHEIEANSDDEALEAARGMKLPTRCELWERERMVAEVPAHER